MVKKWLIRLIFLFCFGKLLLLIGYYSFGYVTDPWKVQKFANQLDSDLSNSEKIEIGERDCLCDSIKINISGKDLIRFKALHDSLLNLPDNSIFTNYKRFKGEIGDGRSHITLPQVPYVKSTLNDSVSIKVKLTGGQMDHFDTEQFSFRIKSKSEVVGLNKVNFYAAKARFGGVFETIISKMLEAEGLIALKSGFSKVVLNEKSKGIYFYQEQPTQKLIERSKREKGIIVRLRFDGKVNGNSQLGIRKTYDSKWDTVWGDYLTKTLHEFNSGRLKANSVFNFQKMASFNAIINLTNSKHGSSIYNCYFYLNPKDSLLEPIGREFASNFYEPIQKLSVSKPYIAKQRVITKEDIYLPVEHLNLSGAIKNEYDTLIQTMQKKVLKRGYLENVLKSIHVDSIQACGFLADPNYKKFSSNWFQANADSLRCFFQFLESNNTN